MTDLWVVIDDEGYDEPNVWLFDNEYKAFAWANDYLKRPDGPEDVWVTRIDGDFRANKETTND